MSIEVPEVIEAADEVEARLQSPRPAYIPDWCSIESRLDDTMRNRLVDWAKEVR